MAPQFIHAPIDSETLRYGDLRQQFAAANKENARLQHLVLRLSGDLARKADENEMLEARISAGIWRRTRLFHVACALLKCEDDTTLTDEQHDALMDEAIRHARTVVSLERLAREEDRARLAQRLAQKGGA